MDGPAPDSRNAVTKVDTYWLDHGDPMSCFLPSTLISLTATGLTAKAMRAMPARKSKRRRHKITNQFYPNFSYQAAPPRRNGLRTNGRGATTVVEKPG